VHALAYGERRPQAQRDCELDPDAAGLTYSPSFLRPNRLRATSAAAAPPNSSTIGGAGTGCGPPLDPVLPPVLEPWPLLVDQPLEVLQPLLVLQPWLLLEPLLLEP
jgi:hypothetical protein